MRRFLVEASVLAIIPGPARGAGYREAEAADHAMLAVLARAAWP